MSTQTIAPSTAGPKANQTVRFLRQLYGKAATGYLCVFTLPDARARWWPMSDLDRAAEAALQPDTNVYFGIGLQRERPASGRGNEAGVVAIPGFWLDLDIQDPTAHVQSHLPADEEEALQFVKGLPHRPTLIVHSGHGLQLYWLFEEPWVLGDERARGEARSASRAWQTRLLAKAAERGWELDVTADLARVFRVPGTYNHKSQPAAPVRILYEDGPRYAREFLIEAAGGAGSSSERTTPLTPIQLEALAAPGTREDRLRYTADVLRAISNDKRFPRDKWVGMAHAIYVSCGAGNEDEARELFVKWSETWTAGPTKPGEAEQVWDTLGESTGTSGYQHLLHEAGSAYDLPEGHPWRAENLFSADPTQAQAAPIESVMQKMQALPDPASPEFVKRLEEAVAAIPSLASTKEQVLARASLQKVLEEPLGRSAPEVLAAFERSRDESGGPPFTTLEDLLARPELLESPDATIPRLAYPGRVILLAGPDKSGKSTLMAHAAAALSRGDEFLGEGTRSVHGGRVVWVGLEEALDDAVQRFKERDAVPHNLLLITYSGADVLQAIGEQLAHQRADLVVIDSLMELARRERGEPPKSGDDAGWATVMRPIVALAREFGVAVVILHHVRKSDGQYRGSTEIAAAVDGLLELSMPGEAEDLNLRHITGRGRAGILAEPFDLILGDGRYEISHGGEISVEARVLAHVRQNPGVSLSALRDAVGARYDTVKASVWKLIKAGELDNRGSKNRWVLFVPPTAVELFTTDAQSASGDPEPKDGAEDPDQ